MLLALLCFLVAAWLTRMVSVGSITASALLPLWGWTWGYPRPFLLLACVMAALIIIKHRANIRRILNGTESKLGKKKSER
ncbi:MAG: hypothetical protein DSY91_05670 [Deltaproteobacteria bacterium]|nr:MAG: hypothetical protein DSY91_05670 [Deltaproteobacteria bacterium]